MRLLWKIGAILLCVVLVACGQDDVEVTTDGTPQAAASPTVAAPESTVGNIVWSESNDEETGAPIDPVTSFTPRSSAIVANIEVTDIPASTEFTAKWTLNDAPIEGSEMQVTAEDDIERAWVTFRFTREDGTYPTGQLGVVITASTGELREGSIEISFP